MVCIFLVICGKVEIPRGCTACYIIDFFFPSLVIHRKKYSKLKTSKY